MLGTAKLFGVQVVESADPDTAIGAAIEVDGALMRLPIAQIRDALEAAGRAGAVLDDQRLNRLKAIRLPIVRGPDGRSRLNAEVRLLTYFAPARRG